MRPIKATNWLFMALVGALILTNAAIANPTPIIHAKPARISQHHGTALTPVLVSVRGGCFQMGSPDTELGRSSDEAQHRVCVKAFKMAQTELTVAEFSQFVSATQFVTDAERNTIEQGCWSYQPHEQTPWQWWQGRSWRQPIDGVKVLADQPVSCVSLFDVMAYIAWLNKTTGQHYRLPTEAEWEYAARGGTATARYWGSNPNIACSYSNIADNTALVKIQWPEAHNCEDGYFFSAEVGQFRANKFALHDMLGNVWEWTCSNYDAAYNGTENACGAITQGSDALLSMRGGGWNANPVRVRAAARNWATAWTRQANLGFRLVKMP